MSLNILQTNTSSTLLRGKVLTFTPVICPITSKNFDVAGNSIVQVLYSLSQQSDSYILSFIKELTPRHYGELYFFLHFTESTSRVREIMSTSIFSEGRESLYGVTGNFRLHEIFSQAEGENPCFDLPDIWSQAEGIVTLKKKKH